MSRFEKSFYIVLYILFGGAFVLNAFDKDYTEALWILVAFLWLGTAHKYRRELDRKN